MVYFFKKTLEYIYIYMYIYKIPIHLYVSANSVDHGVLASLLILTYVFILKKN